ncbi:hypothetical protein ACTXT7_009202, partial [Hymenolepis weldensis]
METSTWKSSSRTTTNSFNYLLFAHPTSSPIASIPTDKVHPFTTPAHFLFKVIVNSSIHPVQSSSQDTVKSTTRSSCILQPKVSSRSENQEGEYCGVCYATKA